MNWKQMKEFCDSLSPEQLEKEVIVWREEEAITKLEPMLLEEDYYVESEFDDEGCFPESEAKYLYEDNKEDYPNGLSDLTKVYDKGTPILMEDF